MATGEKSPPRSWKIDDLLALGKREGKKAQYLKAIPVLFLENWVLNSRVEGSIANYVWTNDLARRLVQCGLASPFKPKATSSILGALGTIQNSRNLTNPPLMEYLKPGRSKVNLPYYESLLEDYRQKYRVLYPEDYEKLFPEEEPEWGLPEARLEHIETEPERAESEVRDQIHSLLAPVEQTLRDLQLAVERLKVENKNLQAGIEAMTKEAPEISFVHTSPDFTNSGYGRKVTTIEGTIRDMLNRAQHAIRISTRQMDMFTDELIALKRHSPNIEIIVLSRGPEGAVGDRKKIAGTSFGRMKQAGIKLPIERDTLHSRLIVIDDKEVLVSSADLDYTQMELEFNAGIWTNNPDTVAEAICYFDNLLRLSQGE